MKILIFSHLLPPAIDGGSTALFQLGQILSSKHTVSYLSTNCLSTDNFINPQGKKIANTFNRLPVIHHLRRPFKILSIIFSGLSPFQFGPIFKPLPFLNFIFRLKKNPPNLIIAGPFPTTIPLYALFLKKFFNCQIVLLPCFHFNDQRFFSSSLLASLKSADKILALTQHEKNQYLKKLHLSPQKIFVQPLGVSPKLIINPQKITFPKNPNILYLGSFSAHKNTSLLVKTFKHLSPSYPKLTLTLAGQETLYYPTIAKLLDHPKISLHLNFSPNKLTKLIDQSTFLVLPSSQESYGLVLLETLSRGKPFIVSSLPPLVEMCQKTNGGLSFNLKQQNDLTQKITTLLNNPKLCQKLGKNGLKYVSQHLLWSNISPSFL